MCGARNAVNGPAGRPPARAVGLGAETVFPAWMSIGYLASLSVVGALLAHRHLERRLLP